MALTSPQLKVLSAKSDGSIGWIAALGDSIFSSNVKGFSGNFQLPTVNLAVPGATATACLAVQIPELLSIADVNLRGVVFNIGVNDCPLLIAGTETGSDFISALDGIRASLLSILSATRLLAVTPFPVVDPASASTMNAISAEYPAIFGPSGLIVADMRTSFAVSGSSPPIGDSSFFIDGVHLNSGGWSICLPVIRSVVGAW